MEHKRRYEEVEKTNEEEKESEKESKKICSSSQSNPSNTSQSTSHPLEYLRGNLVNVLRSSGIDEYYVQKFIFQEDISYLHNNKQAYYMSKKKWMEQFGGNIAHKYPPWIPTTHSSKFYESIYNYYKEEINKSIENKSKEILNKFLNEKNLSFEMDEKEELLICFHNPLPILIFSPKVHTYHFEEQKQSVRFYSNILNKKWKKENIQERFSKIQELNDCITFCCLKNTLTSQNEKQRNDESPILHMNLHPTHICLLACIFFTNAVHLAGAAIDLPYFNLFKPQMLCGILKGCRYVLLNDKISEQKEEQERIRKFCFENDIRKQGFLQGKRRFSSFQDSLKFLKDIPDLSLPKWERVLLKTDQIKTFSANSSLFMFAQKSKEEGEFVCAQMLHELNKEPSLKNIKLNLPITQETLELSERQAWRLELYHKKITCQQMIPSLQTNSALDGSSDDLFECPTLLQNIQGRNIIF